MYLLELTDIMALVKAGYTKDEIAQMEKPQPSDPNPVPAVEPVATPEPEPQPVQAQVVEPVAVPAPVPAPAPAPVYEPVAPAVSAQQEAQPTMADIMQGIAKLTSAVQANAIAQSVIPQGLQHPPSAEDMLAEIIRPTFKERS